MKNETFPRSKPTKRFALSFLLLGSVILSLTFIAQISQAQQASLSLADLLIGLRSKKLTLPERNTILAEAVGKRGITFSLTPELEKELETTGANKDLIDAVRQRSQIIKISAIPVVPKPETVAAATPRPPDFSYYQNRANAHFVKGEFDSAIINYNKVIEINPKEVATYMSRAAAFYNKEYYDKAVADYDTAIELSPKEAAAYFKRADAHEKAGDKSKALADYKKTVELDSTNAAAITSLQRLEAEQAKLMPKPAPQTAPPVVTETTAIPEMVNVGSLRELALRLVVPVYPSVDKLRKTQGLVTVQVMLDEEGKVISADATDGPPTLRSVSEDAVRRSKFKPVMIGDKAVKAKGIITYNFKSQ